MRGIRHARSAWELEPLRVETHMMGMLVVSSRYAKSSCLPPIHCQRSTTLPCPTNAAIAEAAPPRARASISGVTSLWSRANCRTAAEYLTDARAAARVHACIQTYVLAVGTCTWMSADQGGRHTMAGALRGVVDARKQCETWLAKRTDRPHRGGAISFCSMQRPAAHSSRCRSTET